MITPIPSFTSKPPGVISASVAGHIRRRAWPGLFAVAALLFGSWAFVGDGIVQAQRDHAAAAATAIGNTLVGKVMDTKDVNNVSGSRFVMGATSAKVVSLSAYVGNVDSAPHNQYQLAIYTERNGKPYSLVAKSASGTLTAQNWNTLPLSATLAANTAYWLMYNTNGSNGSVNNLAYTPSTSMQGAYLGQPFGVWPSTITSTTMGYWNFSIYTTLAGSTTGTATSTPVPSTPNPTQPASTSTPVPPTANPTQPATTATAVPPTATGTVTTGSGGCGLSAAAFCDSFTEAPQAGGRSGDLNPSKWSVARIEEPYQYMGSPSSQSFEEYGSVPVTPCRAGMSSIIPDQDSLLCDAASGASGQLMTATNGQDYGLMSYRPTQRFDFTNRTGKIVFDVDAATGGGLDKWISLFVTDQPIPGANNLAQVTGLTPRNGVGVNLDLTCGSPYAQAGVSAVYAYANYVESSPYSGDNSKPCVKTSLGSLNHFEVDLSQQQIQVWGSDASTDGGTTFPALKLLASAPLSLPFSVGYVHYQVGIRAPAKYLTQFNLNAPYAVYHWKDLGFDGPVTTADRVYQVPDALTTGPNGGKALGYQIIDGTSGTPQGMYTCCSTAKRAPFSLTQVNLTGATSAQLTLDAYATQADSFNSSTLNIQYRLNGGSWKALNPAPPYQTLLNQNCSSCPGAPTSENWWMALAAPVALSDLQAGTNTLEFTSANASQSFPLLLSNIDLLVSTSSNTPVQPTATSTTAASVPTATHTDTPVPPTATSTTAASVPTATSTIDPPVPPTATSTTAASVPTATSTIDPPAATATSVPATPSSGTSSCQFQSAPQPVSVAFCETFNSPAGIGNRSGGLNGTLWGVSRWTGNTNLGYPLGWAPVSENRCGTTVQVQPENDVSICNGHLVEGTNDATYLTSLAMYPKQPFDIAGRTGTVVFDVSNNSQGNHAAWPEFWYTDKPVPAPFIHENQGGSQNSFGVRFAAVCPAGQGANCGKSCPSTNTAPVFTVDSAVVVRNWQPFDTFMGTGNGLTVTPLNCVTEATGPGDMNHMELRISQNEIDVYATDAGTTGPLKEIATITNANLTLTRGLIWLEDVHYNGGKFNTQRTNTFTWGNVGFDGPTLPRDLAFDANDSLTSAGQLAEGSAGVFLGWEIPTDGTSLSVSVPNVSGITKASAGLLTYNFYSYSEVTLSYRLNNGPWHAVPWPYPDNTTYLLRSVAVPISLSEVQAGTNTIQFQSSDGALVANVDLVMVGAAGIVPATS